MKQSKQISVAAASRRGSVLGALLLTAALILFALKGAQAQTQTSAETQPATQALIHGTIGPTKKHATNAGIAIVLGGALKYDNDAVWRRIVDLAGGKGAKFAVLATASGEPEKSAAQIMEVLAKHGAVAEHIPVAPRLYQQLNSADANQAANRAAHDPELVNKIKSSRGIFFSGGAQERITEALFDIDGKQTPVLAAIWAVFNEGGVVAGTSAGAAIMSATMFRDAPDVLKVLKFGVREGHEIDRGLGFVGANLFVDQHFLRRGRLGRMLPLMVQKNYKLGLGVEENSGAVISHDEVEVIGSKGALVADLGGASTDRSRPRFNLKNARITYLESGDRFNLKTKAVTPSVQKLAGNKIDPNAEKYAPYFATEMFYPDILGDGVIVNAISNLIDNRQNEVTGLAFSADSIDGRSSKLSSAGKRKSKNQASDLGFEFRFRKGRDSVGYFSSAMGGENYTVANIYLDVRPIVLARPLYRYEVRRACHPGKPVWLLKAHVYCLKMTNKDSK